MNNLYENLINDLTNLKNNIINFENFAGKYTENKLIDFKGCHPLLTKKTEELSKDEFLADVVSLANSSGGCLIYGIAEKDQAPHELNPFQIKDVDKLKTSLSQSIGDKIERRLSGCNFEAVKMKDDNYIFIVNVPKSWNGPHGVRKSGGIHLQFYGRTHAGNKYPYGYMDIKNAFIYRENLSNRITLFREQRINKIISGETPLMLPYGAKIILHLIPLSAFESNQTYNIEYFYNNRDLLPPIHHSSYQTNTQRRNFDGLLLHDYASDSANHEGYIQLYRNGIIESVDATYLSNNNEFSRYLIPSQAYEKSLVNVMRSYLKVFMKLEIQPPIFIALTITQAKGFYMGLDPRDYPGQTKYPIDQDILMIPECEITDLSIKPEEILKLSFDLIWNACGLKESLNYHHERGWIHS